MSVSPGNMFRDELELFADTVCNGTACELSAENGMNALAAVEAAIASDARSGAEVLLDDVVEAARTCRGMPSEPSAKRVGAAAAI